MLRFGDGDDNGEGDNDGEGDDNGEGDGDGDDTKQVLVAWPEWG